MSSSGELSVVPGHLLLVDDSMVAIDAVTDLLEARGWQVDSARSGEEALAKIREVVPEVIVCDLNMPDLDGIEVVRRTREIDDTIPVIMFSGEQKLDSVLDSMHAGVFDFVQKRDSLTTLPAAASRAVVHCRVLRENRRLNQVLIAANEALERRVAEQTRLLEDRMRKAAALETAAAIAPLKKELEIAQHIQTSILPKRFEVEGLDIAARMLPAENVGGDYYDIRPVEDGCWIGIGDVSGHGLTAGLLMMMIQSGISSLTQQNPRGLPHDILPPVNTMLWENVRQRLGRDDFATLCLLRYCRSGRVVHAGAHEDILVCRAKGGPVERIATPGAWVGGVRDIRRATRSHELRLDPGDTLVLHTDGITEARGMDGTFYGPDRLCEAVEAARHQPVGDMHRAILDDVLDWAPTPEDDVTLLVIRHRG